MKLVRDPSEIGWVGELVVACAAIGFALLGRAIIDMFAPGVLPFALAFPAVIFGGLFGGARVGAAIAVVLQIFVWYFVLPPHRSFALAFAEAVSLIFATLSLALTVWIIAAYRGAASRLQEETQRRADLLSLALREVDHRTKNNFQIAASLLQSQAATQQDPTLARELRTAAGRLISIAEVYADLALSSADLSTVKLQNYLRELCKRFGRTMLPPAVKLRFHGEAIEIPAQAAATIGLIVNECLTNAAKHAFPSGTGTIQVAARREKDAIMIEVRDDGVGSVSGETPARSCGGTGSTLIATLAKSIKASFTTEEQGGRHCVLRMPISDES
jgi:two-component system, sensor histidine kinase PdtaS